MLHYGYFVTSFFFDFIWYIRGFFVTLQWIKTTSTQSNMKREIKKGTAVIYARVSSEGDRQNTGRQVADLEAYAQATGLRIVHEAFTEHISGAKRNSEREVLAACLDYCEQEHIDVLLISELSRLGRNVWEVQENVKRCIDNGLNVYFQKEQFSLFMADGKTNPFTAIFVAVLGTCAQMEREAIYYRLNSGRAQAIERGVKMGRKVGSTKSDAEILEQYPEAVKRIRKGQPIREIAKLCGVSPTTVQKLKKIINA